MYRGVNNRVLGAVFVGVALVAGAFVVGRMGTPPPPEASVYVTTTTNEVRPTLGVRDTDDDGIQDWQEPFLTAEPVILTASTSYERPTTLTGQLSVNLMEQLFMAKSFNTANTLDGAAIEKAAVEAARTTQDRIYTQADVSVINSNEPTLVRDYANTVANIFTNNNIDGLESEVVLLEKAYSTGEQKYYEQLHQLADAYAKNRDDVRSLPVPAVLVNEHVAIINVFNALSNDIRAFTEIEKDPLKALLRIRRYQDDATGMVLALRNLHIKLTQYPGLFATNDPALIFSAFADPARP
jgi:hypothetical protein